MTWKKGLKIFGILLFLVLLEQSLLPVLFSFQLPVLVFMLSLSFLATDKTNLAFFTALVGGLLMDILPANFVGLTSTFFVGLLLVISYIKNRFYNNFLFLYIFSIFIFSFLWKFLFLKEDICFSLTFFLTNYVSFLLFTYLVKKFPNESKPF
jgi:cell shape-determining protein MreD